MISLYEEFKLFSISYRAAREIILLNGKQHNLIEDIMASFREIKGGLGKGVPPIEFVSKRAQNKMIKI